MKDRPVACHSEDETLSGAMNIGYLACIDICGCDATMFPVGLQRLNDTVTPFSKCKLKLSHQCHHAEHTLVQINYMTCM
jgi:hypothetical protein